VQIRITESSPLLFCDLLPFEKINLIVGNAANIFHCTCIEFSAKNLIIFVEWVRTSEKIIVEFDSSLSCKEHLLMLYFSHQWLSSINSHWRHTFNIAFKISVWTSHNYIKVSGYFGRDIEIEEFGTAERINSIGDISHFKKRSNINKIGKQLSIDCVIIVLLLALVLVWNDFPIVGNDSLELPSCLDIWLIEAWENQVAEVDLKLSVQILHSIGLIFEWVKALATVGVLGQYLHAHFVCSLFQELWLKVDHFICEQFLTVAIFILNQILVNSQWSNFLTSEVKS